MSPVFKTLSLKVFLRILFLGTFTSSLVSAAIQYSPANGGSLAGDNPSAAYYFVSYAGSEASPAQPSILLNTPLQSDASAQADAYYSPPFANQFLWNVNSSASVTSSVNNGNLLALAISVSANGNNPKFISIGTVNGVSCYNNSTLCQGYTAYGNLGDRYYAVKYSQNSTLQIGFYPNDLCQDYSAQGGTSAFCSSSGNLIQPTPGSPTTFQISFGIYSVSDGQPSTMPSGTPVDSMGTPLNITLEVDTPIFSCPDQNTLNQAYSPSDQEIFINTAVFSLNSSTGAASPSAPLFAMYVLGNLTQNFQSPVNQNLLIPPFSPYSIVQPIGLTGFTENVPGFSNSNSASSAQPYTITFTSVDQAGVYTPPTSPSGSCTITGVYASSISGFVSKSNCFIASAAFHSQTASAVTLLRSFRDQVLLKTHLGRVWVASYYKNAVSPAQLILEHPLLKLPLLLYLAPVEAIAYGWLVVQGLSLKIRILGLLGICLSGLIFFLVLYQYLKRFQRRNHDLKQP